MSLLSSARLQRVGREFVWITAGNAAAFVGSVVGVRILTEFLEPAVYGQVALGMTLSVFVNQIVMAPLTNGVTRFYAPALERGDLGGYLKAVRRLALQAGAVVCALLLLGLIGLSITAHRALIAIVCAALVLATFQGWNAMLSGIQNAARQRAVVALHQGMEPWLRFLIAAAVVLAFGSDGAVAMGGYAVAAAFVVSSQYLFFRTIVRSATSRARMAVDWHAQIWTYSWPFVSWGLFGWAQQVSDRWALGVFASTQEVGLYAALFQIGYYPISIATGMAVQFFLPVFYGRAGDATDAARNDAVTALSWQITLVALGLTALGVLTALLLHQEIFSLLAAREYGAVSGLLPWAALGGGLFASGQILALNFMSQMKTTAIMVAKIVTSVVGVLLNFGLGYLQGMRGVVFASVLFGGLYFAWMLVLQLNIRRIAS